MIQYIIIVGIACFRVKSAKRFLFIMCLSTPKIATDEIPMGGLFYMGSIRHGESNIISQWVVPDKYFVTFPMSAYNVYSLRKFRAKISDFENNFFLTHEGQTVKDNKPLAFTMFGKDLFNAADMLIKPPHESI